MYRVMNESDFTRLMADAIFRPNDLWGLTPGMFVGLYGVPTDEQWADMQGLVAFDGRARLSATASTPAPARRSRPSGYRPLAVS